MNTIERDPAVARALDLLAPEHLPDPDSAWQRQVLRGRRVLHGGQTGTRLSLLTRTSFRVPAGLLAAGLVLALMVATPVRGIAAQFLTIFRVQDVTPITVQDLSQPLPDLTKLGDMSPNPREVRPQITQVASLNDASSQAGFTVQTPSQLPSGLSNPPSVLAVMNGRTVNFTFRAAKVRAYLDANGHKDTPVPANFDGATLTLHIPTAVSLAYLPAGTSLASIQAAASSDRAGGKPDASAVNRLLNGSGVMLVEAKSPELDATGVSADDLRNFLLNLPGIPEQTRTQLQAIGDWKSTLPVPAPPGSNMHKVSVNGAPGVAGQNGPNHMVLWVRNGIVYAATGPKLDEKALLSLASSVS
ncbi:MAG TPA: hypothetical protein VK009_25795 [Chloroflexota bacterium]|nr:hypothetical protein [Chloroflexota bacterium]